MTEKDASQYVKDMEAFYAEQDPRILPDHSPTPHFLASWWSLMRMIVACYDKRLLDEHANPVVYTARCLNVKALEEFQCFQNQDPKIINPW